MAVELWQHIHEWYQLNEELPLTTLDTRTPDELDAAKGMGTHTLEQLKDAEFFQLFESSWGYAQRCKRTKDDDLKSTHHFLKTIDADGNKFIDEEELTKAMTEAAAGHENAQKSQKLAAAIAGPFMCLISGVCGYVAYKRIKGA